MAFTFTSDLLDPISRIRFKVGDTTEAKPLLDDAFYEAALRLHADDEAAAARALAAHLAVTYAQKPDELKGIRWSERVAQWRLIAHGTDVQQAPSSGGNSARSGRLTAGSDYRVR